MQDVFEIGSHSRHHTKLNKVSLEEAKDEIVGSKREIEKKLGLPVVSFSYPKGRSSQVLEILVRRAGYTSTTADTHFHKVRPDPDDSFTLFKWKALNLW